MGRTEDLERLEEIRKQHRQLDEKATELASRLYLTQEEEEELVQIKKMKLQLKDEMFELANKLGVEI